MAKELKKKEANFGDVDYFCFDSLNASEAAVNASLLINNFFIKKFL